MGFEWTVLTLLTAFTVVFTFYVIARTIVDLLADSISERRSKPQPAPRFIPETEAERVWMQQEHLPHGW